MQENGQHCTSPRAESLGSRSRADGRHSDRCRACARTEQETGKVMAERGAGTPWPEGPRLRGGVCLRTSGRGKGETSGSVQRERRPEAPEAGDLSAQGSVCFGPHRRLRAPEQRLLSRGKQMSNSHLPARRRTLHPHTPRSGNAH